MLSITKKFEFEYAHYLPNHKGCCANLHGHRGQLEITISADYEDHKLATDGIIIDFSDLKKIVQDNILVHLDHKCLNDELQIVPTAENMVIWAREILLKIFSDSLVRIRIYETSNSYAEWVK